LLPDHCPPGTLSYTNKKGVDKKKNGQAIPEQCTII